MLFYALIELENVLGEVEASFIITKSLWKKLLINISMYLCRIKDVIIRFGERLQETQIAWRGRKKALFFSSLSQIVWKEESINTYTHLLQDDIASIGV